MEEKIEVESQFNAEKRKQKPLLLRLMTHAGASKISMVLSWLFSGLGGIISLGPYICIYFVARDLLNAGGDVSLIESGVLTGYGWQAVGLTGLSFLLYGIGLMLSHFTAFSMIANIRIHLVKHLGELPLGYHIGNPSGKLRKIIEKNTESIENFVAHQLPDLVQAIITPIAFLISIFIFDWRLALICLLPIGVGFVILRSMLKGESDGFLEQYQASQADMSNAAVEYVRGISVVKVFGQTVHSFERFYKSIMSYKSFVTQYALSMGKPMSGYITAVHGIFFVLIPAGIVFYEHSVSPRAFILSFIFFVVFTPLVAVLLMKVMYSSSNQMITKQALDTIEAILDEPPMPMASNPQQPRQYDIKFEDVSFQYEDKGEAVIDHLSFEAKQGTITALVGASGGGKSTVINLIARFWDVGQGAIKVGGIDLRDLDYKAWLDQVSFVFQDISLFKMSIADNVAFNRPSATEAEILKALHLAQCDDIIEKLPQGIQTVIGSEGTYLSGGQMQRIALARAILKDAPIILLDEATAFADPENEYKIQKALDVLMKGKTVLMIAHRLSTVTGADQILVLNKGRLVEHGNHQSLVAHDGTYAKMYREYQTGTSWKIGGRS